MSFLMKVDGKRITHVNVSYEVVGDEDDEEE